MLSTATNHINASLAQEVADEIQTTTELFAIQGEQERVRKEALATSNIRPSKVARVVRKFANLLKG